MQNVEDPLVAAVTFGAADDVRALLMASPDAATRCPYSEGCASLLHEAAAAGHAAVVELLLHAGASPGTVDEDGQTPLHHAASEGHVEVVKRLAPAADCKELYLADSYQMTAYHLACENGHDACVGHLRTRLTRLANSRSAARALSSRGHALVLLRV